MPSTDPGEPEESPAAQVADGLIMPPPMSAEHGIGDEQEVMSAGNLQQRAVQGAAWTVINTFVGIPIAFGVNLVVARVLGAADYGRLALLTALMEFVSAVLTRGVATAVIQFGSKAHAAGRTADVARLLSQWQGFRLLVAMPVLGAVVFVVADVPPEAMVLALVFGVVLPAALDGGAACLGIENKTADGAKIALLTTLITQVAVLAVAWLARTPDAVWATRLVVSGSTVALCLFRISPAYRVAVLRPMLPRGLPPGFWAFAVPMGLAGVVSGLISSRSEVFVMSWLAEPAALGIYALAFGLAVHAFAPAQALVGPLIPAISGLREVDEGAVRPAFRRVTRAGSTVVALILSTALAPLALLVPLLYGAEFEEASPVVLALGITAGLATVGGPVFAFVSARLSGKAILAANLIALVVDIGLAILLIPILSTWGAVIANAGGAVTTLTILGTRELRALGLPARTALRDASPAVIGSVCSAVVFVAGAQAHAPVVVRAVGAGLAGGLLCIAIMRVLRVGLTSEDRGAVGRAIPSRAGRVADLLLRWVSVPDRRVT